MSIDAIRQYIRVEILDDETVSIEADEDLMMNQVLDSMDVMRLVTHLEQSCGFKIPPQDVTLEHFSTLRRIDSYVTARRNGDQLV
ncbi:MAG: acyl carrier protein [Rhodocyclaceae bacterium]|nr:acyl carrier protein [Rhodocyclaceae bacterium]